MVFLDVVNSFESLWNWRLLLLPGPDWELRLTSNAHVQVLNSCHSLCLRRAQVKPEKQVLPNYRQENETERETEREGSLSCLTASSGRTSKPKLPVHPHYTGGSQILVSPPTVPQNSKRREPVSKNKASFTQMQKHTQPCP